MTMYLFVDYVNLPRYINQCRLTRFSHRGRPEIRFGATMEHCRFYAIEERNLNWTQFLMKPVSVNPGGPFLLSITSRCPYSWPVHQVHYVRIS